MTMQIDRTQLWHAASFVLKNIGSAALVMAFVAYFAVPRAQDFIKDTVADRLNQLENQMDDVQRSMTDQKQSQAVMGNEMENLARNQDETQANTRMILQSLQGIRRDLQQD